MWRILVAEDDPAIRIPMARFLREQKYRNTRFDVIEVYHPKQAQDALRDSKSDQAFDVIVLDLVMPGNNPEGGRQVLEFMAGKEIYAPVIVATAYGYDGPADRVRQDFSVVKGVLTKSFPLEELWKAIETVLEEERDT
jgi:CheY-like chemotaxis protein